MTTSRRPSDQVAERIKAIRLNRGWTAKDLAAACAEQGAAEITPAVIANIESGRRGPDGARRRDVSIDELLIFAYALDVPPASLLENNSPHDVITITGNIELYADDVVAWLHGSSDTPIPSLVSGGLARCGTCDSAIRTRRRHDTIVYYCANTECDDPVLRPALNIDYYLTGHVLEALKGLKEHGVPVPSEDEWSTFPAQAKRAIFSTLFKRVTIPPTKGEEPANKEGGGIFVPNINVEWKWN